MASFCMCCKYLLMGSQSGFQVTKSLGRGGGGGGGGREGAGRGLACHGTSWSPPGLAWWVSQFTGIDHLAMCMQNRLSLCVMEMVQIQKKWLMDATLTV